MFGCCGSIGEVFTVSEMTYDRRDSHDVMYLGDVVFGGFVRKSDNRVLGS